MFDVFYMFQTLGVIFRQMAVIQIWYTTFDMLKLQ